MRTFPIMLDLCDRPVVVVGAGAVGLRKAESLRDAGARVKLISRRIDSPDPPVGIDMAREPYRKELLGEAFLVFACTDDRGLNTQIARDARTIGALVNVADTPDECDFYLSATVRSGDVVVAIGTGGAVPALSAWLKRRISDGLPPRLDEFAAVLEEIRRELRESVADSRRRMTIMKQLVCEETYQAFLNAGAAALRAELRELLAR